MFKLGVRAPLSLVTPMRTRGAADETAERIHEIRVVFAKLIQSDKS